MGKPVAARDLLRPRARARGPRSGRRRTAVSRPTSSTGCSGDAAACACPGGRRARGRLARRAARRRPQCDRSQQVRFAVFDFDGVFTDNRVWTNERGGEHRLLARRRARAAEARRGRRRVPDPLDRGERGGRRGPGRSATRAGRRGQAPRAPGGSGRRGVALEETAPSGDDERRGLPRRGRAPGRPRPTPGPRSLPSPGSCSRARRSRLRPRVLRRRLAGEAGARVTDPLFDLDGRIAVVTGIGQLGSVYASGLAERGMQVAVFDVAAGDVPAGTRASRSTSPTGRRSRQRCARSRASGGPAPARTTPPRLPPDAPAEEVGPFETYRRSRSTPSST